LQPSTVVQAIATDWTAATPYAANDVVKNSQGNFYLCVVGGTSAGSEPTGTAETIVDNAATWTFIGRTGDGWVRIWGDLSMDAASMNGGYANAAGSVSGARAIAEYRGSLAVMGLSSVAMYALSADAGVDGLDQAITGPGVRHLGTLATMSGDLIYADSGGRVRTMSTDTQSVGAAEAAIGDPVVSLVAPLVGYNVNPVALYARSAGLYLLAQGTTVAVLSVLPGQGVLGWSQWSFPAGIGSIDAITECRGAIYLRCGNAIYQLADNAVDDEVDTGNRVPIACTVRTVPTPGQAGIETYSVLSVLMSGPALGRIYMDGRLSLQATMTPSGSEPARRYGSWPARRHQIEIINSAAPAGWRVDGIALEN
jgi:hypothetical protein